MSIITTFVDQATPSWVERLSQRCQRAAVAARTAVAAVIAWARSRVELARSDQRGLETAEIVLLGSIILVAVAAIGAAVVTWLNGKLGDITKL
jgi:hypothetical protein